MNKNKENTKTKIKERINQSNEIKMNKKKTIKKVKNCINKFKISKFKVFYQNIRGLKSKGDSLIGTISDDKSMLICLIESHLWKEEEIRIWKYSQIIRNKR